MNLFDLFESNRLAEDSVGNPVVNAILRRIIHNPYHNVIELYGSRAVMDAIKEVADWV